MQPNSVGGTFLVATVLCIACSLVVSSAAVGLSARQADNKELDRKKNVLLAAGLCEPSASAGVVSETFASRIEEEVVELPVPEDAAEGAELVPVVPADALMGVRERPRTLTAYKILAEDADGVEGYIFPVEGKGLWSTLKGYLAVKSDGQTVEGITFYSHAETPGLGGEVDNQNWKNKWKGKKIYDAAGEVDLDVIKGVAGNDFQIDGLSGATITSNGVDGMVSYWFGEQGFGPWLKDQTGSAG